MDIFIALGRGDWETGRLGDWETRREHFILLPITHYPLPITHYSLLITHPPIHPSTLYFHA
ncbi:hypothetical protein C7B77_19250 [Chamaesiphon polymorphus CCALA 037]|uniref:Uncharacterized protein n=1 Tax=Chamaesiphon polymorphus CCALA 037 TaxID=2107692 RepID=A0A2T1G9G3_9CYAN|nr:hypothetical protein C7B77_19250 [Chamaesiphon polymorphus CCALA 037]